MLDRLVACYPLVGIVSGRAPADVAARVQVDGLLYAGNHGLEQLIAGEVALHPKAQPYMDRMQRAAAELQSWLLPGMTLEDKGVTISLHYRRAAAPAAVVDELGPRLQAYADERGLRLNHGRMVYELRPPVDVDKGSAFRQIVDKYGLTAALYAGDDTTDVDVFKIARQMRAAGEIHGVAVGVKSAETPPTVVEYADLLVEGVGEMESLLAWLVEARGGKMR